jgi:hypothetical protein
MLLRKNEKKIKQRNKILKNYVSTYNSVSLKHNKITVAPLLWARVC